MKTQQLKNLIPGRVWVLAGLFTFITVSVNAQNIFINEISGNEKWLELYNAENNEIDISGYLLIKTDEKGKTSSWRIPSGTKIAGKGFIAWEQGDNANLTFTWGISARKNVTFQIFNPSYNELDKFEITYDLFSNGGNRTVGRKTDGADELVVFSAGTKGTSNNEGTIKIPTANPKNIYVNEISGNEKWLEIYNAGNEDVDLTGFFLEKLELNPEEGNYPVEVSHWFIPDGTIIPANGYIVWEQGDEEEETFTWGISSRKNVGFKIYDSNATQLDFFWVNYDLFSNGGNRTVGRKTDGAGELVVFSAGTKGTSNNEGTIKTPTANPKKIYINEISGNEKWLEIYNDENEPVSLAGYFIEKLESNPDENDIPDEVEHWFIPENLIIEAKGFLYWTQDKDNTDGTTFTWGITAKRDVGFKIYDSNATGLDFFWVGENLYHEGENQTVGRETDGAVKLVIFQNGGTPGKSNGQKPESINGIQTDTDKMYAVVKSGIIYLSDDVEKASVINICGIKVKQAKAVTSNTINVNNLPKGIYIIKMIDAGNRVKVQKILIP